MPQGGAWKPSWSDDSSNIVDPLMLEAIGRRMRYADLVAPDATEDPGSIPGITQLAQNARSDTDFQSQMDELYGFNESGKIAADLMAAPQDIAWINYQHLPKSMQAAVRRQGFVPEEYGEGAPKGDGKPSGLFGSIPGVGGIAQAVSGFVGEEILSPAADVMNALGRASTQLYRTGVAVDEPGRSFLNPGDWQEAWSAVGNGATYVTDDDRDTLKADYDLDDKELDTYLTLSQGKLPGEIAEDEGYEVGTQAHVDRVRFLYDMAASETGLELVGDPLNGSDGMLNNYRVSFGRFWTRRAGFEPESLDHGIGRIASGTGDLAWAIAADPTLLAGKAFKTTRLGQIAINNMDDVNRAVDAGFAARMLAEGGWSTRAQTGVEGLRALDLVDETGTVRGAIAKTRLSQGNRIYKANDLITRALGPEGVATSEARDELFRTFPQMYHSFIDMARHSNEMVAKGRKGLDTVEGLEDFLRDTDGYRMVTAGKFGGKNTAEFARLPEVGRSTEVKMRAKGLLNKAQDWANDTDQLLQQEIGIAGPKVTNPEAVARGATPVLKQPGKISHVMRALSPVQTTPEAKRLALSLNPAFTAGRALVAPLRFTQVFTTHVPRAGFIGLWQADDLAEFSRFLDMGKMVGMDQGTLNRYRDDFIGWAVKNPTDDEVIRGVHGMSAANRSVVLRSFTTDLMSRFDIDPQSDLSRKFLDKADEIFGLNPDGTAKKGQALALSQTAEARAIPSMRDFIMATNRYSVMRSIFGRGGVLNPRFVDAALTRYWKPGVLMRMGFIGRAAGEELLAYLARYGSANYIGQTIATGVAKRKVYDEVMGTAANNPTREIINDLRTRTPEQWEAMLMWGEHKGGAIPDARELLSWGQSQALAPFTGVIHAMDSFMGKVLLEPWQHNLAHAPKWRLKAADRMRRADDFALRTSIRVASTTRKIAPAVNPQIQRLPGLHQAADALDATLFPILSRLITDMPTFRSVANQVGLPTKEQAARLLAHIDDDDWEGLNELLTDPFIRKAHLEQVIGGDTLNLRIEPGAVPEQKALTTVTHIDAKGRKIEQEVRPEGNVMTRTSRPADHMDPQDYDYQQIERIRHLMDPKTQLGRRAIATLSNHFSPGVVSRIAKVARDVPLGQGDDLARVGQLVREVRNLPIEHQRALADAVETNTVQTLARDLSNAVVGDDIDANLRRGVLDVLADTDTAIHQKLLNPMVDPDMLSTDIDAVIEEMRKGFRVEFGKPGMQRLLYGHEGRHENLTVAPREGYLQGYGIGTTRSNAAWATQNLNGDINPELKEAFIEEMRFRLEHKGLPDIAQEIGDELFDPMYPASTINEVFQATPGAVQSIPVSFMASSNADLADEIVNTLSGLTGKHFELQRLDIPETTLQNRVGDSAPPTRGSGGKILDHQDDWQQSILWRVQMEDFSGAMPLPPSARKTLVQAPPDPRVPTYDIDFGPPEPEQMTDLAPTMTRWEWTGNPGGNTITDIIDHLPDVETGKVRLYGERPTWETRGGQHGIQWHAGEPEDIINDLEDLPYDWYFADVPEDEYAALVEGGNLQQDIADAHHFASDGEFIEAVDDENIYTGFDTLPQSFEQVGVAPVESWKPGYSPVHYVGEHEATLRRLANTNEPWAAEDLTDEVRDVMGRLGVHPERLVDDDARGRIARRAIAQRADNLLVEGRKGGAMRNPQWWDEDDLKRIADEMGGEWSPTEVEAIHDEAIEALQWVEDPDEAEAIRERLMASRDAGMGPAGVSARNAAAADLDRLVPGWRSSEGWDRVGTGELFGIDSWEPAIGQGGATKHFSVGTTPGERDASFVDDQIEEFVRNFTNKRAGVIGEERGMDEYLYPLARNPSPNQVDVAFVQRAKMDDRPMATFGHKYVTSKSYGWDRLTNWFFDDVAAKGISSIVRNQLFATNYLKARKLNVGLVDKMVDADVRSRVAAIVSAKWGMDEDQLDELLRMYQHGMVEIPFVQANPWDEVMDVSVDAQLAGAPDMDEIHKAVQGVQNSVLLVPGPEVSIPQANRMLRASLGLKDTPKAQHLRTAGDTVTDSIVAEQQAMAGKLLDQGASREEVADTIRKWRADNKEIHDLRYAKAREEAADAFERMRAKPEQMMTDPEEMARYNAKTEDNIASGNLDPDDAYPDEMVADLSGPELAQLRHYVNQRTSAMNTVRDSSIQRAMEGTIPFIDDHRIRSQFQEYVGNLIPFWFAEEQFLKRWARIFKESPDAFRKGQLAMHGLRTIGAVHTDPITGKEYYVYPGSAAATSIFTQTPVAKVLFGSEASLPTGLALTGDVKHTLPGFGDQFGTPSAGPFVGIAMEMLASRSPEWAKAQQAVMGDIGSNRQLVSYLVPSTISRFYSTFSNNTNESQLASALIETAQLMEASGHGLKDDATAEEVQEYIDQVEANARSVQLLRAFTGFVAPASPGIDNSAELPLSNEFASLTNSGIPYSEALMMFMEHNEGDVSPYTVFRSEVPSGAPMANTPEAYEAMQANEHVLSQFPMAAPWMLLPFRSSEDEFSNRAYRHQIRMGLRKYRSLPEYVSALSWADASPEYFDKIEEYDALIESYRAVDDQAAVNALTMEKSTFATSFKNSHPVFADKLMSSEGRVQRQQILHESFMLLDHPDVQNNERVQPMREMLDHYRAFDDAMVGINTSRAKVALEYKDQLTMEFQGWLGLHLMDHPELRYFYDRVIRPELSWDRSTLDESMVA